MKIRERHATILFAVPISIIIIFLKIMGFENDIISISLLSIPLFFGHFLYLLTFNDTNSTCAFFAGKKALENSYDPVGQDGKYWDPSELTVSQVGDLYIQNRKTIPDKKTCGFVLYLLPISKRCYKIEFYNFEKSENLCIYNFFLDHLNPLKDAVIYQENQINKIKKNMRFVSLNKMK